MHDNSKLSYLTVIENSIPEAQWFGTLALTRGCHFDQFSNPSFMQINVLCPCVQPGSPVGQAVPDSWKSGFNGSAVWRAMLSRNIISSGTA